MVQEASLYDRVGGVNAIAMVVDDFIERVLVNPVTQANPKIVEGYKNMTTAGLKYLVTEQICAATGGPQSYTGRAMSDSHSHLDINAEQWEAFVSEFVASLNKFAVPQTEQEELLAFVGSTKGDIVQ